MTNGRIGQCFSAPPFSQRKKKFRDRSGRRLTQVPPYALLVARRLYCTNPFKCVVICLRNASANGFLRREEACATWIMVPTSIRLVLLLLDCSARTYVDGHASRLEYMPQKKRQDGDTGIVVPTGYWTADVP